jgi:hypothetical protein
MNDSELNLFEGNGPCEGAKSPNKQATVFPTPAVPLLGKTQDHHCKLQTDPIAKETRSANLRLFHIDRSLLRDSMEIALHSDFGVQNLAKMGVFKAKIRFFGAKKGQKWALLFTDQ